MEFKISYELSPKVSVDKHSPFQIQDIVLSVSNREEILPTLNRMYPMFKVDLTTCNIVRKKIELAASYTVSGEKAPIGNLLPTLYSVCVSVEVGGDAYEKRNAIYREIAKEHNRFVTQGNFVSRLIEWTDVVLYNSMES